MEQFHIKDSFQFIEKETYEGNLSAHLMHEDGKPYHTFRTYTALVDGSHITFKDCTFINRAGKGKDVGQAIALYLDGDDIHLENCILKGHQDTLFLAPLPEKEREVDGFLGPKQFEPRVNRTFYFSHCYIEGGVDFIFGGATAYFDDCEFCSNEQGYIFAANTPKDVDTGIVARHCKFTCTDTVEDGSCYIGRPWRDDAKIRIQDCELGRHIHPRGWIGWNTPDAKDTTIFEEIRSVGVGASDHTRPSWVKVL